MTNTNKDVPFYFSPSGDPEEDKKILEPFEYSFLLTSNKLVYTKAPLFLNYWLKISSDKFRQIQEIIHLISGVSCLFDDIQDGAISRGGDPAVHTIYGVPCTISAAHYLQLIIFEKTAKLHPMATQIVLEQMLEFNRGQGMDMYLKNNMSNSICPNEKDYKIMASRKSTWIPTMTVNLMKLFSTYKEDLSTIINLVGLYRQIHDDYVNLRIFKEGNNDCCDDLAEGKISFLVVHALTNNPNDSQIVNILKRRPRNIEMKRYFIKLLENYGSFKYTRDVLDKMEKEIKTEMDRLGGNPFLKSLMDDFKNDMPESRLEASYVAPLK